MTRAEDVMRQVQSSRAVCPLSTVRTLSRPCPFCPNCDVEAAATHDKYVGSIGGDIIITISARD